MDDYFREQERRLRERRAVSEVAEKAFLKTSRAHIKQEKLLLRWEPGTQVRHKKTGGLFIYRGNVNENGEVRYLLDTVCPFGYLPVRWSVEPTRDLVRV